MVLKPKIALRNKGVEYFRVSLKHRQCWSGDGYIYPLTNRFLHLYYYLALARLEDWRTDGGRVYDEEIKMLPLWERNTGDSAGTQIRRHIKHMEKQGRNLIEADQKIYGPFRLSIPPSHIKLDVSIDRLKSYLGFPDSIEKGWLPEDRESDFYEFVEHYWTGEARFNEGEDNNIDDARRYYQVALSKAITPEQRGAALLKIARTLERQGENALPFCQKALDCFEGRGEFETWGKASVYSFMGWIIRRHDLGEAERLYLKALALVRGKGQYRILGDICNGRGLIRHAQGQYKEALRFYQRALEYWALAEYFYGIQGAYFNIGALHERWGNEREKGGHIQEAMREYDIAKEWIERGIALCEKLAIAYDTSQDRILLSAVYRKLGDPGEALRTASLALKTAEHAGNKTDIAESYKRIVEVYLDKGEIETALSTSSECMQKIGKTEFGKAFIRNVKQEFGKRGFEKEFRKVFQN